MRVCALLDDGEKAILRLQRISHARIARQHPETALSPPRLTAKGKQVIEVDRLMCAVEGTYADVDRVLCQLRTVVCRLA